MYRMNHLKSTREVARRAAVAALLAGAAVGAIAQYKIVGPDGKVTYTDKPPAGADARPSNGSGGSSDAAAGLPYATRQALAKYPVTLYSTRDCPPCDQARQALRQRGVPFNEYTVSTDADLAALKSRFGDTSAPTIAIGTAVVKGFSATNLAGYLDAAGYPAQARLGGYRWPPATPLATPAPAVPEAATAAATPATPAAPLPPSKSGIQF
jgi:glutaredoxin